MDEQRLRHICEVCGTDEILTPAKAYEADWDYPPKMGAFGVISPRVCPRCPINRTVWWALTAVADDQSRRGMYFRNKTYISRGGCS